MTTGRLTDEEIRQRALEALENAKRGILVETIPVHLARAGEQVRREERNARRRERRARQRAERSTASA